MKKVEIKELSVIIPTWNSMPEFERCLASVGKAFPEGMIKEIIVVDKGSKDGTRECAERYGCTILTDTKSLGSARLVGIRHAKTEWISFIDSDIELPLDWFDQITTQTELFGRTQSEKKIGWIYGRTIDDIEPLKSEKTYKMERELKAGGRALKKGDRAYTNNTICIREPLINAKIEDMNAWEDWVMAQEEMDAGYVIYEVPVTCGHLRSETYEKFGTYTEAWCIAGELKAKGMNMVTMLRPFWFMYWGVKCTVHFRELMHFQFNMAVSLSMIKALIFTRKKAFSWSREKKGG